MGEITRRKEYQDWLHSWLTSVQDKSSTCAWNSHNWAETGRQRERTSKRLRFINSSAFGLNWCETPIKRRRQLRRKKQEAHVWRVSGIATWCIEHLDVDWRTGRVYTHGRYSGEKSWSPIHLTRSIARFRRGRCDSIWSSWSRDASFLHKRDWIQSGALLLGKRNNVRGERHSELRSSQWMEGFLSYFQ